ncbi:transmembrane protein 130 isoform X2 [Elephas maximus indicus]|uniref:transmembrane protein 130 isoform X2 n=1 Tax=Elephas maximus indicus TaxID=99487 RepID=UPI0021170140|nr:transmembrane protein 130 isoform X2 [Elephas maximus indicus]
MSLPPAGLTLAHAPPRRRRQQEGAGRMLPELEDKSALHLCSAWPSAASTKGRGMGQHGPGLYELRLTTDGPATTGAEVTISASFVTRDNGSLALPTDAHLYRFHWIHTPLVLTGRTEKTLSSTIRVVSNVPGDLPVSVWVTAANCWTCQPVARGFTVIPVTEFLVGNLVIAQNSSLPWPSSYLTKTPLKISFLLHDPSNFFKSASLLYNWDFGDGTQMVTEDPVIYYNYSIIGTFTMKLKVVAEWELVKPDAEKSVMQKTGDFSALLKLQETLRGIQIVAPTLIQAFQKATVTLNFLGSPPLTMCWRLKPDCHPPKEGDCHSVSVASTTYNLTHTFRSPGDYCFSIRAENVISKTHQYHRIQVWPASIQPAVFAFPCATIITVMLAIVMYMTLRNATQPKDMVENPEPPSGARCCCQVCCGPFLLETPAEYLEIVRENHGLLPPLYKSVKTYTV